MLPNDAINAPWRDLLLNTAEKNAVIIGNEVINDAVLGKSVTSAVSPYFSQSDATNFLRDQYAKADDTCRDLRARAAGVMRAFGLTDEWDSNDLKAADEGLWSKLMEATARAADINKQRTEARDLEREALANAIDVIDTCAGIAALRHLSEFRCEGDAFCGAYVAALSIADTLIGKSIKSKGMKLLSDFLQFCVGTKPPYREVDIYTYSKTVSGIGHTMGIESTAAMQQALLLAIKKNASTPSQLRPQLDIPEDNTLAGRRNHDNR
ncbi:MAG TPA: hypothetical protein VF798_02600 [Burkholderiaceae bacterium]